MFINFVTSKEVKTLELSPLTHLMDVSVTDISQFEEKSQEVMKEIKDILSALFLDTLLESAKKIDLELNQKDIDLITPQLQITLDERSQYEHVVFSNGEEISSSQIEKLMQEKKLLAINDTFYDRETLQELDYTLMTKTRVYIYGTLKELNSGEPITVLRGE